MIRFDRERFDERWGAWAMAALIGSTLGTVGHFAVTGRLYFFKSYPVGPADWLWLVGWHAVFIFLSRTPLGKAGWGLALAAATVSAATAPIQALATPGWWVEGAAILLAGALVFAGLPSRHVRLATFGVAAFVLVSASIARIVALRILDETLSTTVIKVQ